jgi:hypothetical protein
MSMTHGDTVLQTLNDDPFIVVLEKTVLVQNIIAAEANSCWYCRIESADLQDGSSTETLLDLAATYHCTTRLDLID